MKIKQYILSALFLLLFANQTIANTLAFKLKSQVRFQSIDRDETRVNNHPVLTQNSQEAEQLFKQGIKQYQNNRIEAAIKSWQEALKLYRKQQNSSGESLTLGQIGLAYEALENYLQAVDYFEQTLAVVNKSNNSQLKASILGNLGNNYLRLSNYPQAIESYQQSLTLWQQLGDRSGSRRR